MELYLIYGIFLLLVGALLVVSVLSTRRLQKNWMAFAKNNQLVFDAHRIHGRYEDVEVEVELESLDKSAYATVFRAKLDGGAFPAGLLLFRENELTRIGKGLGAQDVQVGIERLDRSFIIRARDEAQAREFLRRPQVRDALLRLYEHCRDVELRPDCLSFRFLHAVNDAADLQVSLQLLVDTAQTLLAQAEDEAATSVPGEPERAAVPAHWW